MIYYAASTNAFYDSDINTVIPDDAVEINSELRAALLQGQSDGKAIGADSQGYPILVDRPAPTAEDNRQLAVVNLNDTDWVNQPDVFDPAINPHLMNRSEFLTYRAWCRNIAINPVAGNLDWPTMPSAKWSS